MSNATVQRASVPKVARPGRGKNFSADRRPGFLTYGILLAFLIGSTYPLWYSFVIGSSTGAVFSSAWPPLLPGGQFWVNVAEVFDSVDFWAALGNSLVVASVITFSVVSFSTLAGYAFAKLRFRGRQGLLIFVIATLAVPTQLGIIPMFMMMKQLGWTGSLGAIMIPTLVTAFGVFFMRQYLVDNIPDELIEAARVDGASMIGTFWHVGVPAARPAMAILSLFTFMTAWTDYLWPMLVAPQTPTLQVALSQLQSARYVDYTIVMTGALMATIPLLLLFVVAGKQLVSGIMAGAVKG
ncbi:carbohydrate ABC transporter permease [Glutamicibacter halophytocola]|uniref:Carbohydrate ABC transporter permease n=1 Tax=Glutamicibacter halophytocola TaxID=1933880 RepID=A0AA95BQR3_9MICC|nr:carbohydrate ABC transporter permease [Glutamicibacter halophytocola]UUX59515.1 carbohydrate ABC transporter permease [Glutamicibacter halophytocola]